MASSLLARLFFKQANRYAKNNLQKTFFSTSSCMQKSFKIPLPALSPTMESGTIISWEKKEGDRLEEEDVLAEIETDKATMGFETPEEGYLAKVVIPAGTKNIPVGKILCVIVDDEAEIVQFKDYTGEGDDVRSAIGGGAQEVAAPPPQTSSPPLQPATMQQTIAAAPLQPRSFVSPLAKKLARDSCVSLPQAGSGLGGRIVAGDLEQMPAKAVKITAHKVSSRRKLNLRATITLRLYR